MGRSKDYHQYNKSFVTLLTTGCDTVMWQLFWPQISVKPSNKHEQGTAYPLTVFYK